MHPLASKVIPSTVVGWYRRLKTLSRLDQYSRSSLKTLSSLERLPFELLQHIASHLPASSAASLALCSHHVRDVIGTQCWVAIRAPSPEKRKFLSYMEQDLPDHRLCDRCAQFHRRDPVEERMRILLDLRPKRKCAQEDGVAQFYPWIDIQFYHVQLAMNRHRFGPAHGLHLSKFSRSFPEDVIRRDPKTWMQARIVDDTFILRWETKILIGASVTFDDVRRIGLRICPHLWSYHYNNLLFKTIACRFGHAETGTCNDCTGLIQCRFCPTEFELSQHSLGPQAYVLVLTVWRNFGSGRSSKDPRWRRQVRDKQNNDLNEPAPLEFPPGSIRSAFDSLGR